jgi:hypothetical protein
MRISSARLEIACLVVLGSLVAGCTSIPQAAAMRASGVPVASKHQESIGVLVSGGQDFDFRISDAQFEQALRESLVETGMFARVVEPDAGDLRLDVVLGDGQGTESREITVLWSLSRVATRETLWQELVTSHGSSHHFVGVVRARRGIEMAGRENVKRGLEKLARVDFRSLVSAPPPAADPR